MYIIYKYILYDYIDKNEFTAEPGTYDWCPAQVMVSASEKPRETLKDPLPKQTPVLQTITNLQTCKLASFSWLLTSWHSVLKVDQRLHPSFFGKE